MSDVLSSIEIAGLHAELLPARTVLSAGFGSETFDYTSNDDGGEAFTANQANDNVVFGDLVNSPSASTSADDIGDVNSEI